MAWFSLNSERIILETVTLTLASIVIAFVLLMPWINLASIMAIFACAYGIPALKTESQKFGIAASVFATLSTILYVSIGGYIISWMIKNIPGNYDDVTMQALMGSALTASVGAAFLCSLLTVKHIRNCEAIRRKQMVPNTVQLDPCANAYMDDQTELLPNEEQPSTASAQQPLTQNQY